MGFGMFDDISGHHCIKVGMQSKLLEGHQLVFATARSSQANVGKRLARPGQKLERVPHRLHPGGKQGPVEPILALDQSLRRDRTIAEAGDPRYGAILTGLLKNPWDLLTLISLAGDNGKAITALRRVAGHLGPSFGLE